MFSAFTAWGMLAFSSAPPRSESIYNSIVSLNGGNFDDDFAGPINADWYATAMAVAAARDTLERAENQADPLTVEEMLPVQESMYGLAPGPSDNLNMRRGVLAARYKVALEPSLQNVNQALRLLLGADFVAWVPNPIAAPSPDTIPLALCKAVTARAKTIQFVDRIIPTGGLQPVRYKAVSGDTLDLQDREVLTVDPGLNGIQESVTVIGAPAIGLVMANFAHAHEAGAVAITGPFPNWTSFKKNSLVVVKNGRATDPLLRAKVNDLLSRMLSGTSTWDIVQENSTPGTAGPIRVGQPSIGTVPIGTVTYVSL